MLAETANWLARGAGHGTAVDVLERLQVGSQFELVREPPVVRERGVDRFASTGRLSFADAVSVAGLRHETIDHRYSFDDEFDGLEGLTRLGTPDDPFAR